MQALKQPTADAVLLYLRTSKLDRETELKWKERIVNTPFPIVEELFKFLDGRCGMLELTASSYQTLSHSTTRQDNLRYRNKTAYANCTNPTGLQTKHSSHSLESRATFVIDLMPRDTARNF